MIGARYLTRVWNPGFTALCLFSQIVLKFKSSRFIKMFFKNRSWTKTKISFGYKNHQMSRHLVANWCRINNILSISLISMIFHIITFLLRFIKITSNRVCLKQLFFYSEMVLHFTNYQSIKWWCCHNIIKFDDCSFFFW